MREVDDIVYEVDCKIIQRETGADIGEYLLFHPYNTNF